MNDQLKALMPKSRREIDRFEWVIANAVPEILDAIESRQITIKRAETLAMLPPETQRQAIQDWVAGKPKVIVLPGTEDLLIKNQRIEMMKQDALEDLGLDEFQREFKRAWLKLVRKHGNDAFRYGELWRKAESVIIRLSAPPIEENDGKKTALK